jgi:rhamnosyl/mannosyltransferase
MADAPAPSAHRAKCVVIPYGLDADRFRPTAAIAASADALRAQARGPILLFVGRLVPYKGLDVLLRAMPELDAQLVVVGDGPLRGTLETMVQELRIGHRVHLTGAVTDDERLAWLHACAVLVLPSITRQESFGVAQLEAMLCGRPVVSTDVPTGVCWVNVHGQTGFVARAGDTASLRQAIERLLADGELRRVFGEAARTRVLNMFTADTMCSSMLALYHEVVAPVRSVQAAADRSEIASDAAGESP